MEQERENQDPTMWLLGVLNGSESYMIDGMGLNPSKMLIDITLCGGDFENIKRMIESFGMVKGKSRFVEADGTLYTALCNNEESSRTLMHADKLCILFGVETAASAEECKFFAEQILGNANAAMKLPATASEIDEFFSDKDVTKVLYDIESGTVYFKTVEYHGSGDGKISPNVGYSKYVADEELEESILEQISRHFLPYQEAFIGKPWRCG